MRSWSASETWRIVNSHTSLEIRKRKTTSRKLNTMPHLRNELNNPRVFGNFTDAFIDELATFLLKRRVLEIFAGNGALAALLARKGVAVTATSKFTSHDGHENGLNHPVIEMGAAEAVRHYESAHDVLLMSWPTVTNQVTIATQLWGPDRPIVYIGEITDYEKGHLGGCADDEFFETIVSFVPFETYRGNILEAAGVMKIGVKEKMS